ncbi:MAG TPA: hypothetical protein VF834_23030 [Streptosporangiaceae bacterium]
MAAALSVLVLAASAAPAVAVPPAAAVRAPLATVPWQSAGPGWAIAEYNASIFVPGFPGKDKAGPTTLYLTSPQGHKYPFYTWPATYKGLRYTLLDWSGDRQRVLLASYGTVNRLEQISLVTGKVVSAFSLPTSVSPARYTRPDGLNLLALRATTGSADQVVRYDLTGHRQAVLTPVSNFDGVIDSPDGTAVVAGTSRGLVVVGNTGQFSRSLHAPVAVAWCSPVRYWNALTVLAVCAAKGFSTSRLWLFPVGGGTVKALTPQRGNKGPDLGDFAAWRLTSGLYLQALGACGSEFIARQDTSGAAHPVNVPGTAGNNQIVTGLGARLLVRAVGGCPGGGSLLWFDPATSAVQYVLHPASGVVGVEVAVPYGRPLTS